MMMWTSPFGNPSSYQKMVEDTRYNTLTLEISKAVCFVFWWFS
jgi:hypothetical protein